MVHASVLGAPPHARVCVLRERGFPWRACRVWRRAPPLRPDPSGGACRARVVRARGADGGNLPVFGTGSAERSPAVAVPLLSRVNLSAALAGPAARVGCSRYFASVPAILAWPPVRKFALVIRGGLHSGAVLEI